MYALQMVEESGNRLKRGTIYVTLGRMEDKGYIKSRRESDSEIKGPKKRFYKITAEGRKAYFAWDLPTNSSFTEEALQI